MKGHCFYQLGNEDAALECYQKAEQMHGLAPEFVYTYIGLCKVSKGEWEEGYENLEKAIQANEAEETPAPTLPSFWAFLQYWCALRFFFILERQSWNQKILKPT